MHLYIVYLSDIFEKIDKKKMVWQISDHPRYSFTFVFITACKGMNKADGWIDHSHSALFDVVTPSLSCPFSYLYIGPSYPTPNA